MSELRSVVGKPIHLDQIDRQSIRRLVTDYMTAAGQAAAAGENIHQWSLDQHDKVERFVSTLNEVDALNFWTIYNQEMQAAANTANDKANEINLQVAQIHVKSAQDASNVATWISLIVFFGFLIFMINMFKR